MKRVIVLACGLVLGLGGCAGADKGGSSATVPVQAPLARTIGTGFWQDMRIQAQESAPASLYIPNGAKIIANHRTSFDLKVLLTDRHEGTAITDSRVSAAITRDGRTVFRGEEVPTLSGTGVPDYENDVSLPGPGTYRLVLTVGAPEVAARHLEYAKVWRLGQTHRMLVMFTWK